MCNEKPSKAFRCLHLSDDDLREFLKRETTNNRTQKWSLETRETRAAEEASLLDDLVKSNLLFFLQSLYLFALI